jgi:adenosylcobinamide amidohydrolase
MSAAGRGATVSCTQDHVYVALDPARIVLSSAVVGGGLTRAGGIVNLKVAKQTGPPSTRLASPEATIAAYCRRQGWQGPLVGMMTAASMGSFRRAERREKDISVITLVTAGISNAGRAGDRAAWRTFGATVPAAGTVNMIVLTNAALTEAALVEAVITVTEAKAAAFADLGIRSVTSGRAATGTGTDSVAVVSGPGPATIRFCGKHALFGEMLADTAIRAISDSLGRHEGHQ